MSPASARARRMIGVLLSDPAVIPLLMAVYVSIGVLFVLTDYTLNDEGLLTYYWAGWARREFVPVFLFQRIRPVLSALYLPISPFGVHATLIAHVLVASLAIPMITATARATGHRLANLPAIALVCSPLFFYGGPAGISNVDGVVATCLVLYLLSARQRPLLAGIVAGMLPWVRPELFIFSAAIGVYGLLFRRDRMVLAGLPVFPLLYLSAGAAYHRDPLWFVHFPPTMPQEAGYLMWQGQLEGARYFLEPLLAVTALAPLVVAVRPRHLPPIQRILLGYFVASAFLINVLPLFRLANFGTSPRYSMLIMPALVLLAARVFEPWWEDERPTIPTLLAVFTFGVWLATRQQNGAAVAVFIAAYVLLVVAAYARSGTAAGAIIVALLIVGIVLPIRREVGRSVTAPFLDPMVQWLDAHQDQITKPLLTNSQLLDAFLQSRLPGVDVRFVAWNDISRDVLGLSNPANGQRELIRQLCDSELYGGTQFGPITPEDVPPASLFVLRAEDIRLPRLMPEAVWSSRLEVLAESPLYRVARLRPEPDRQPTR